MKLNLSKWIVYVIMILVFVHFVSAQYAFDTSRIFNGPGLSGIDDLGRFYENYSTWINFLVFMFILLLGFYY